MNKKQRKRKLSQARAHQNQETSQPRLQDRPTDLSDADEKERIPTPPPTREKASPPGWPYHVHRGVLHNMSRPIVHIDDIGKKPDQNKKGVIIP